MPHQGLRGDHFEPQRVSVIAGALAFYLVITALLTVRPPRAQGSLWIDASAMLVGLTVGIFSVTLGFEGVNNNGKLDGQPIVPVFIFGAVALLAAFGDMRMMARGVQGTRRIARHLWRMCFALFIASGSFFLGQADKIPEPLRIIPLLMALALAPLLLLLYWLWRVRIRRTQLQINPSDKPPYQIVTKELKNPEKH
ncbi:hypothetical protein JNM05_14575 [bacterium]|nr:hypothetical protein [bacterium]